jgi:hypothetical protein
MKRILEVKKKIGTLSKNSKNPFFKSQYLDLHTLLEAVEPLLQEQGLILLQPIIGNAVNTQIIDSKDGAVLVESTIDLPAEPNPQKLGMAITYFRRYTLTSLLAISESDDDGNSASKKSSIVVLSDENIKSSISKGTQKETLKGIKAGKFSANEEQINQLSK